jgi:1,2-diacylglycerol-3-alpha-glucose alpha-1,2-glucosyltransferase
MKVALYFEFHELFRGKLFKQRATGMLSSFLTQKIALKRAGVAFTEGPDLSADILQLNAPFLRSRWLMKKFQRRGKKVAMYAHTTAEDAIGVVPFARLIAPLYRWYLSKTYGRADAVFCPSPYTRGLLIDRYKIPAEKCHVVSNGVDTAFFKRNQAARQKTRAELKIGDRTVIGTVGLVVPRKGLSTFTALAEKVSQAFFIWIGPAFGKKFVPHLPYRKSNLLFAGYVPSIPEYLSAMDIFLFPSHEENQGIAILEAAANGLPLIVRDLPTYRGWLVHEKNALIAKKETDFEPLLKRLIADSALRERLGAAALKMSAEHDVLMIGQRLKQIYQNILR